MRLLRFEPLDVFSIRSARPFDIGGVVQAEFVWPPPGWTVMGALRGVLSEVLGLPAVEYGHERSDHPEFRRVVELIGPPDGPATFSIGPVLVYDESTQQLRWPVPFDVLSLRLPHLHLARLTAIEPSSRTSCNLHKGRTKVLIPPPTLPSHPEKSLGIQSFDQTLLTEWLEGKETLEPEESVSASDQPDYRTEPRIGITIDRESNLVKEGRFYLRSAVQLEVRRTLAVPLLDTDQQLPWHLLRGQLARFGADGHLVRFSEPIDSGLPRPPGEGPLHRARLLCVGPIHPNDIDQLQINGTPVHVRAVAAGKPITLGGWRLIARQRGGSQVQHGPRTLRTYYPAGTVLYAESEGDLRELHGKNLAIDPGEKTAGFGFCLVGRW